MIKGMKELGLNEISVESVDWISRNGRKNILKVAEGDWHKEKDITLSSY